MKSTETSPSTHVPKKSQPEESDLVILGGGTVEAEKLGFRTSRFLRFIP